MGKLFGTDGIRGLAGKYPITPEMALSIGKAAAAYFRKKCGKEKAGIIIGKDSRISGDMLEAGLTAGITEMGVDVVLAGVIPTPAIAYLAKSKNFLAGIMISASHNPFEDNGIKLFKSDGFKLTDKEEEDLESLILEQKLEGFLSYQTMPGRAEKLKNGHEGYVSFLRDGIKQNDFKPMNIVLDCSNGATSKAAPMAFEFPGLSVTTLFDKPDGVNINKECGSQHTGPLSKKVIELDAAAGFAFDGDGDRLIAVTEEGAEISGDQILAICAKYYKEMDSLSNNTVVTTVMSNLGLGVALGKLGISHIKSDVGDRNVAMDMIESGSVMGGEDSGHMIFMDRQTTGDGICTALKLLEIMNATGRKLSELAGIMDIFPQVLINVPVESKPDVSEIPEVVSGIEIVEKRLGDKGRVLVRYSGTQNLCRVMVEGPTIDETDECCRQLADLIKKHLG